MTEQAECNALIQHAFAIGRTLSVSKFLVQAKHLRDVQLVGKFRDSQQVLWLTSTADDGDRMPPGQTRIRIPEGGLTRFSQVNMGLFSAVLTGDVDLDETVICVCGVAGTRRLDALVLANPRRDIPWFRRHDLQAARRACPADLFLRVVDLALRFSAEGREGQPIGTAFLIASPEDVASYTRQLVLNPCKGHSRKSRNVFQEDIVETLREFAVLDGAMVVSREGILESAGTFFDAPTMGIKLSPGLGARHAAAAATTALTESAAVVLSQSSGSISVLHDGEVILDVERPRPKPQRARSRHKAPGE